MLDGTSECIFLSRQRLWSAGIITSIVFLCSKFSLEYRFSHLCVILAFLADAFLRRTEMCIFATQDRSNRCWGCPCQTFSYTVAFLITAWSRNNFPIFGTLHAVAVWGVWGQSYKTMMSAPSRAVLFLGNLCQWLSTKKRNSSHKGHS